MGGLQDQFTWLAGRNLRMTLALLFGSVVMVLAIACLNVTSLLVMRSFAREREFAIRAALGSGRGPLLRQLLAEATILTLAGRLLGSSALTRYLSSLLYGITPTDLVAFGAVFATMLAAAALAMVFPAKRPYVLIRWLH
jgi:ABC-type lipoprotein release transport system permease subunit